MVTNQLFPLPPVSLLIEAFAAEQLRSVADGAAPAADAADAAGPAPAAAEPSSAAVQAQALEAAAYHRVSLYFALCTRKPSLLRELFEVYARAGPEARAAFHRNMTGLARTLGPKPPLLERLREHPAGAEPLAVQALQALADVGEVSEQLLAAAQARRQPCGAPLSAFSSCSFELPWAH